MKILVSDNVSESSLKVFRSEPSFNVVYLAGKLDNLAKEVQDAEALVVRSATKATAELIEQAAKLRVIGRAGVGVDNVNLEAATRKGIVVMNTPGGNAASVAEHTFGLLLGMARRIPQADSSIKQGKWEKKKLTGIELRSKTLGLIGFGRIGNDVARLAHAFEMRVIAYDPFASTRLAAEQDVRLVELDELMKESDFISLHASATEDNHHLLDAKRLAIAKPGARIVNCARGELIDGQALYEAIESGRIAGAGIDVFETEPPTDNPLAKHPNVIATPHIAGSTEEAQEIVGIRIAEQVRDYLLTGVARNAVNLPPISVEERKKLDPYLQLGEKLGAFLGQIAGGRLEEARISYDGGLAELNTHLVKNAVLKGVLGVALSGGVNLINAGALAQERGIEVVEVRSARRAAFSNSLGIALRGEKDSASVLGMVGMRGDLRVLGINDIDIDAPLKGHILFIRNQDVPGVIGRVGTILGNGGVNIASFALGRNAKPGGEAIGLVNVDHAVPAALETEIRGIPAVHTARVVVV